MLNSEPHTTLTIFYIFYFYGSTLRHLSWTNTITFWPPCISIFVPFFVFCCIYYSIFHLILSEGFKSIGAVVCVATGFYAQTTNAQLCRKLQYIGSTKCSRPSMDKVKITVEKPISRMYNWPIILLYSKRKIVGMWKHAVEARQPKISKLTSAKKTVV